MNTTHPRLRGYPIDTHLRDSRAVVTPWRTTVRTWLGRAHRAH